MSLNKCVDYYEVLSPWAEADPITCRGITERIPDISGRKIGMLVNSKRTAEPALRAVETEIKKRFPDALFSWFFNLKANELALATDKKEDFEKWLDEVDTVISAYGD